ncbi:hypothetical protein HPB47_026270 [Ixodes persulcatus]|uniref:Uncharacterized protein n=1 Tax=Ixodes persulcatus TaxID=34615 RepID=A0AC60PZA3_IXOPE|nr:hypothetical protein HPB47_026270 [Ixodes persulcatus]
MTKELYLVFGGDRGTANMDLDEGTVGKMTTGVENNQKFRLVGGAREAGGASVGVDDIGGRLESRFLVRCGPGELGVVWPNPAAGSRGGAAGHSGARRPALSSACYWAAARGVSEESARIVGRPDPMISQPVSRGGAEGCESREDGGYRLGANRASMLEPKNERCACLASRQSTSKFSCLVTLLAAFSAADNAGFHVYDIQDERGQDFAPAAIPTTGPDHLAPLLPTCKKDASIIWQPRPPTLSSAIEYKRLTDASSLGHETARRTMHLRPILLQTHRFGFISSPNCVHCNVPEELHHVICGPPGAQEQALQDGLNTVADYLREVGMAPSPEKTTYVVVADASNRKKGVKDLFNLCLDGRPIQCQRSIRVLGLPIDEDGGASTWLTQVTKTWRQTLGLIRRATSKSWGANKSTLRMLVHALLTSKAMYGINYLRVTGAQKRKLEVLNREAMRLVVGLPRFAPIEELHKHSRINTLEDRAETHRIAQVQRLERTRPGRAILQLLGYQLMGRPTISPPPPPWEDEAVVDHRPMKQNVDKDQKGRRNNAAKKHAESVQDACPGSETVHVYTDAAIREDGGGTAIAWFCLNTESKANFAFHKKHSTKEAELRAILFAVEDESLTPEGSKHLRVYTDSKEALATCRKRDSPSKTVKKIKARAKTLKTRGVKITISWVPGHAGIEGNERAHEAARELIPSPHPPPPPPATGQNGILDNPPPVLIQVDSDDEEEPDWNEEAILARLERRRVLRNKLPEDDDPLPNGYGRWATVRLRRLRTGTAVSPAVRAKFERCALKTDAEREHADDGSCRRCATGQQATSAHLIWDCVELGRMREEAIRKLQPKLRPGCLRDWIHPRGAPQHRKAILDSLLDFVAKANIQDCI